MIVTSGALVLVAIALLIGGLASTGTELVWASIVVSLVSAVFLAVGVYQRRNDVPGAELDTPAAPKVDEVEGVRTVTTSSAAVPAAAEGATVLVVEGRPRYHAAGCRYLAGKDAQPRSLSAARAEGYNACGVCKPDEAPAGVDAVTTAAAALTADEPTGSVKLTKAPADTSSRASKATASKTAASKTAAKKAPAKAAAKKTATKAAAPAAKKAPAKKATATKAAAPVKKATVKKAPVKKAAATKTAAKKTATKAAAKKAAR